MSITIPDLYDIHNYYPGGGANFWIPIPATEEEIEQRIDPFDKIVELKSEGIPCKIEDYPIDERIVLTVVHRGVDYTN